MSLLATDWQQLAVLAALVERSKQPLGRTAIMKLCYFLQTLRQVPLGYHFTLYSYGPFDSTVLDDLAYDRVLGAIVENTVTLEKGYAYQNTPGPAIDKVKARAGDFLSTYESELDWVLQRFGGETAANLEILSTLVFVDRLARTKGEQLPFEEAVLKVHGIKPRFSENQIRLLGETLRRDGILTDGCPSARATG